MVRISATDWVEAVGFAWFHRMFGNLNPSGDIVMFLGGLS